MAVSVILEKYNGIAIIKINRPSKANSMDNQCVSDLLEAFGNCEEDNEIHVIVFTGVGDKAFSSGGNLKEELLFNKEQCNDYNLRGIKLIKQIYMMKKPVIAAINGYALGASIPLICACDLAIASDDALFGMPTISMGGISGWGSTQIVPKTIGKKNTKYMLIANESIDAEDALRISLINKIVKKSELMNETLYIASKIAKYPPKIVGENIDLIDNSMEMSLDEGILAEAKVLKEYNSRWNFKEGIVAFLEKREPKFDFNN